MPYSSSDSFLPLTRRHWLQHSGAVLGVLPVIPLLGCAAPAAESVRSVGKAAAPWLSGGTAAITAAVRGINPFASAGLAGSCRLTCEATIGPCHTLSPERMDVSDG